MYNHYIPQSDGSYRRSSVPEGNRRQAQRPAPPPPPPKQETEEKQERPPQPEPKRECQERKPDGGLLSILRRLLPREIDSTDLLVIVLLLLLSDQEGDDDLAPLLTIALYFML